MTGFRNFLENSIAFLATLKNWKIHLIERETSVSSVRLRFTNLLITKFDRCNRLNASFLLGVNWNRNETALKRRAFWCNVMNRNRSGQVWNNNIWKSWHNRRKHCWTSVTARCPYFTRQHSLLIVLRCPAQSASLRLALAWISVWNCITSHVRSQLVAGNCA